MIFVVSLDVMRQMMSLEAGMTFFHETDDRIDLYLPQGGVMLKASYFKDSPEADLIWKDDNLTQSKAIRVLGVEKSDVKLNISTG